MVVQTMMAMLFLLSSPFIIFANVLIVCAYFRFKRLQTPSNALIVSLAASDFGFGLSLPIVVIYQILVKKQDYTIHSTSSQMETVEPIGGGFVAHLDQLDQSDSSLSLSSSSSSSEQFHNVYNDNYNNPIPLRPCAILLTFSISSIFSIGAIAFDRLLSVGQPLRYNHYVTSNYIQRFLITTWFLAIIVGLIPFIDWFDPPFSSPASTSTSTDTATTSATLSFSSVPSISSVIPSVHISSNRGDDQVFQRSKEFISWIGILIYIPCLLCVILSYSYIYMIARGHSRAIYMVEVSLNHGDVCHLTDTSIHHHRYGLTLAFLLTIFIVSWTPIFGSTILDQFVHMDILQDGQWRAAIIVPTLLSPLLNPLLYGFRSSEIRICVVRIVDSILTRLTGRPRTIDIFQPKGELTSCASNVRLLAVSPNETTIHCCPTPTPTHDSRNHLQILLCDQTSL